MALLAVVQYLGNVAISERVYWGVSVITLLLAFFLAWREQSNLAETLRAEHQRYVGELTAKLKDVQEQLDEKPLKEIEIRDGIDSLKHKGKEIIKQWEEFSVFSPIDETKDWLNEADSFCRKHLSMGKYDRFRQYTLDWNDFLDRRIELYTKNPVCESQNDLIRNLFSKVEILEALKPKTPIQNFRGARL